MKSPNNDTIDPLEFCDLCFQRGMPNLCETYKNTFTKISPIHFSQQAKLDRLLNTLQVMPRMVNRRWTCTVDTTRKEFLDSLWGIGVSVHTLDDHLKVLTRLYKPEIRKLGDPENVDLPNQDSWEEFNPKTRAWNQVTVHNKNKKFTAKVRLGNVLKCTDMEGTSYYRTNKNGDSITLVPMEKRAAYNIMCTIAEPTVVYWKPNVLEKYAFIDVNELNNIPDEIFSFLQRLGRKDKRVDNSLMFENEDLDLVRDALSCIKINLEKSSDTVNIESTNESNLPVTIKNIVNERLQVMLDIIKEMGGIISSQEDHLVVSGKRGSVKITFVDDDKSTQDGNVIQISISALEDSSRFSEVLSMIRKKLGLLDVSLDVSLAQHWPILNDADLQYVIQSAISWYSSNPILAGKIISESKKLDKIKSWYTKIKEGKIRSTLDTITLGKIIKRLESN
ncbi:MAG TPA: hypothetical protein VJ771_04280 [Candidatus Nitrosotalea sp.]|nr:hypothetical protein [Candidatus Nitrosotalea sp.]